jgi:type VI secretion system secreted protein Hcp
LENQREENKAMQHDVYCKFDGVKGSCTDDKHKEWIELVSYKHVVHQAASESASAAIGHGTGKSEHDDFQVEFLLDASFPKLFELAASGKYLKDATIELCQAAGGDKHVFLKTTMNKVTITKVDFGGTADGFPTVKVGVRYDEITHEHAAIKPDGTKAGTLKCGWNRAANKTAA